MMKHSPDAYASWPGSQCFCYLFLIVWLLVGCTGSVTSVEPSSPDAPTTIDTSHSAPAEQAPTPVAQLNIPETTTDSNDTGWQPIGPGIERRRLLAPLNSPPRMAPVHAVRLEQSAVRFRVGYAPEAPRPLGAWCEEPGVVAAINGGFFDDQYRSTALVVSDGSASGTSYQGQGGMFAVDQWGNVSLRYLGTMPYDPAEPLLNAMQGWPMLIQPGGGPLYVADDEQQARRSVIAMDRTGRVLLLAFPGADFTLRELTDWLGSSDMAIDSALNLDGGSSTGLCVQTATYQEHLHAYTLLPMVLTVLVGS